MANYKAELNSRKKAINKKIVLQKKTRDGIKFNTTEWWLEHKKLNGYRLDLETINSRIDNLGKNYGGITPVKIANNNNNNTTNKNY